MKRVSHYQDQPPDRCRFLVMLLSKSHFTQQVPLISLPSLVSSDSSSIRCSRCCGLIVLSSIFIVFSAMQSCTAVRHQTELSCSDQMIHHGVRGFLSLPLLGESPILGEGEVSIVTEWQLPLVAACCLPPLRNFHLVTTIWAATTGHLGVCRHIPRTTIWR
jgi:hypothetical protein